MRIMQITNYCLIVYIQILNNCLFCANEVDHDRLLDNLDCY